MDHFKSKYIKTKFKVPRIVLCLIVVIAPLIASILLVNYFFDMSLNDFQISTYFNEEVLYWNMTKTFKEFGFQGGYYTTDELPASLKLIHFGPWGPMYPIIYGSIAKVFKWDLYSAVYINIGLISLSLIVFIYITKLNNRRLGVLAVLLTTFWPMLLFIPSNMQQSLRQTMAILFAGIFYKFLIIDRASRKNEFVLFGLISFASLIHFNWAILFFPFFFIGNKDLSIKEVVAITVKSTLLVILFFVIFRLWASKYSYSYIFGLLPSLTNQPNIIAALKSSLRELYLQIKYNLLILIDLDSEPLSSLLRVQILSIMSFFGLRIITKLKSKKGYQDKRSFFVDLFHLFNLGIPFTLNFIFYGYVNYVDYRFLAPHLLLSLLLLLLLSPPKLLWLVIVSNFMFLNFFGNVFEDMRSFNFIYDRNEVAMFQTQTKGILNYDEKTRNPWCNTLLIPPHSLKTYLIGVPSGIGISRIRSFKNVELPLKSKYILFNEEDLNNIHEFFDQNLNLKLIKETSFKNIYFNLDSNCVK